ncbi:YoaK family protein [Actinomyces minihominis]|uniref:YoaK family protein n=1 Tax=Actinomyces minihominis TaxID=2002838 RepID=UPI000C07D718|nr:YoaK family protein [Actinomyces minihominis]
MTEAPSHQNAQSASGGLPQGTSLNKLTSKSLHPASFPLMEMPHIAFLLAISAGLLNAWTFAHAQTFATVQSGNVIQMGYQLAAGNWEKLFYATGAVVAFGLGSFTAGAFIAVAQRKHARYTPIMQLSLLILMGVALVLITTEAWRPEYITWVISFAAGMQGNGFHKIKGMLYGNVAVTLVVQLAFNYLMQSFFSKKDAAGTSNLYNSGLYFLVLLGFAGGGAIGFGLDKAWNGLSVVGAMLITLVLMLIAQRDPSDPDPT